MELLDKDQLSDFRQAFNLFDKDNNGKITFEDMLAITDTMKNPQTKNECIDMITGVTYDGLRSQASMDYDQFLSMVAGESNVFLGEQSRGRNKSIVTGLNEHSVEDAFKMLSDSDSETINLRSMKKFMNKVGDSVNDAEATAILKELGSESFTLEEFSQLALEMDAGC